MEVDFEDPRALGNTPPLPQAPGLPPSQDATPPLPQAAGLPPSQDAAPPLPQASPFYGGAAPGGPDGHRPRPSDSRTSGVARAVAPSPTCAHARVTRAGSNAHYKQKRCLDCDVLLERVKVEVGGPQEPPVRGAEPSGAGCQHHRVTWKWTNGSVWRRTCLDCGYVATGPVARGQHRTPVAAASSSTTSTAPEAKPDIYLTVDETERALRAFNSAVRTKIEAGGPECEIRAGALVESLQLALRLTTVFADDRAGPLPDPGPPRRLHPTTSAPASVPAPPRRMLDSDLHPRLRVKAASSPTEDSVRGLPRRQLPELDHRQHQRAQRQRHAPPQAGHC